MERKRGKIGSGGGEEERRGEQDVEKEKEKEVVYIERDKEVMKGGERGKEIITFGQ